MSTMLTKQAITHVMKLGMVVAMLMLGGYIQSAQAQTSLPDLTGRQFHINYQCGWCNLHPDAVLYIDQTEGAGVYRGRLGPEGSPLALVRLTITSRLGISYATLHTFTITYTAKGATNSRTFEGAINFRDGCFFIAGTYYNNWQVCAGGRCWWMSEGPYPFSGRTIP